MRIRVGYMKKHFWKIEYSITLMVIFAVFLLIVPISFSSHEAKFISKWNETYNNVDYMFSAMSAQADSDIVKGIKNATSYDKRELLMIQMVKPYLRLEENEFLISRYKQHLMNGKCVTKDDLYYFDNLYYSKTNKIVGIKDIMNERENTPGFMMMFDMNGIKGPNTWGKDIYGIKIYSDGKIAALGKGLSANEMKNDCSATGTGISCSYFYRIGGEFNE